MYTFEAQCKFELTRLEESGEVEVRLTDRDGDQVLLNKIETGLLLDWIVDLFEEDEETYDRLESQKSDDPELEVVIADTSDLCPEGECPSCDALRVVRERG